MIAFVRETAKGIGADIEDVRKDMKSCIAEYVKDEVQQYVAAAYSEGYAKGLAESGVVIDGKATNYKIPEYTLEEVREMVRNTETFPDGVVIVKYKTEDE